MNKFEFELSHEARNYLSGCVSNLKVLGIDPTEFMVDVLNYLSNNLHLIIIKQSIESEETENDKNKIDK